jgi:hypothetical protein
MKFLPTIAIALLLGAPAAYAQDVPADIIADQATVDTAKADAYAADLAAAKAAFEAANPQVAMAPVDPSEVHAVMFEVTISADTGVWTHAQVIGGYKDHDSCVRGIFFAAAATSDDLAIGDIPVFLCPQINIESIKEWQEKPGT